MMDSLTGQEKSEGEPGTGPRSIPRYLFAAPRVALVVALSGWPR